MPLHLMELQGLQPALRDLLAAIHGDLHQAMLQGRVAKPLQQFVCIPL